MSEWSSLLTCFHLLSMIENCRKKIAEGKYEGVGQPATESKYHNN